MHDALRVAISFTNAISQPSSCSTALLPFALEPPLVALAVTLARSASASRGTKNGSPTAWPGGRRSVAARPLPSAAVMSILAKPSNLHTAAYIKVVASGAALAHRL